MYIPPVNHTMQILNGSHTDYSSTHKSFESKFVYVPQEKKLKY